MHSLLKKINRLSPQPCLLILIAIFSRLIPHPPNMTALFGAALFAGYSLRHKKSLALAVPMVALFLSDLVIGLHSYMWGTYAGIFVATLISLGFFRDIKVSTAFSKLLPKMLGAALTSSTLFFLISNLSVWAGQGSDSIYPPTLNGLISCFVAALPFYKNSLVSDLCSGLALLAIYEFWVRKSQLGARSVVVTTA